MRAHFVVPAAIVILPWAACARQPPQPLPVQAESTSTEAASAAEPADSATQVTTATAIASGPTTTPDASTTAVPEVEFPSPPKPTPKDRQTCAALGAKVDAFLGANQSCKTPADCVEVRTACGTQGVCGTYLARDKEPGLHPLMDELSAAQCFAKGVVPCPSCPPLGPPVCVGGKCRATR
jgi:hypothetical protein